MKKPDPIPPEILEDATTEVFGVWMRLRGRLVAMRAAGEWTSPFTDPHRLDLLAATLTQAVVTRVNGLYPMHEVHLGPPKVDPIDYASPPGTLIRTKVTPAPPKEKL